MFDAVARRMGVPVGMTPVAVGMLLLGAILMVWVGIVSQIRPNPSGMDYMTLAVLVIIGLLLWLNADGSPSGKYLYL